jgi:fermentation-respiration switch protein FrsA (DUF1100 family)
LVFLTLANLILRTPLTGYNSYTYLNLLALGVFVHLIGWLAIDAKFDNLNKVDKLTTPIIIFQGDQDNIVPQEMAKRLFQRANEPKALYLIPGGGHSDLFEVGGEKYKNAWIDLIRQWVPSEIW